MPTGVTADGTASPFASWRGNHAGLRVSDLDVAIRWYADILDFRLVRTMPYGDLTFAFISPVADERFGLELLAGPGADERAASADIGDSLKLAGWHHVCFGVESVDVSVAELKRRGVRIVIEPTDVDVIGRRIAFFADPWGNLFELTQPKAG